MNKWRNIVDNLVKRKLKLEKETRVFMELINGFRYDLLYLIEMCLFIAEQQHFHTLSNSHIWFSVFGTIS